MEPHQGDPIQADIQQNNWKAVIWRTFIIILFILFIVMGVGHLITNHATGNKFNLSILITHFLYQVMVAATLGLFAAYIFLDRMDTTIIPCEFIFPLAPCGTKNFLLSPAGILVIHSSNQNGSMARNFTSCISRPTLHFQPTSPNILCLYSISTSHNPWLLALSRTNNPSQASELGGIPLTP